MKNKLVYFSLALAIIFTLAIPYDVNKLFGIIPIRLGICVMICFSFLIEKFILKKEFKKTKKLPIILFLSFIALCSLSILVTYNKINTIYTILKFLFYGITFYIIYVSDFSKKDYLNLIKVFFITSLGVLIFGILNYLFRFNISINGIYKYDGAIGRIYSTFSNSIYYGIFCVFCFIIACYFYFKKSNTKLLNIGFIIYFILIISNLYLTYTRSAYLLCFGAFFLIICINLKNLKQHISKFIAIFIIFLSLIIVIPGSTHVVCSSVKQLISNENSINSDKEISLDEDNNYMYVDDKGKNDEINIDNSKKELDSDTSSNEAHNNSGNKLDADTSSDKINDDKPKSIIIKSSEEVDGSMLTRTEFKKLSKRVIKDHKILGVGFGSYKNFFDNQDNWDKYVNLKFGYPHNNYLHIYAETGIFSLILFILIIIYIFVKLLLKSSNYNNNYYILISWICILLLCFYESFFYDSQSFTIYIIIFGILYKYFEMDECKKKKVMFISSVGGHLTQMLNLKEIFDNYNYILVTEKTDVTKNMKNQYNIKYLKYGSRDYITRYVFIFTYNIIKSVILFLKYSPDVIVTTGTHTAVPMCYIGWFFKRKIIFIESFAKSKSPTLSGRLVYPIATTFIVQWKSMLKFYPKAKYLGGIY